jgi:hypothetical protein
MLALVATLLTCAYAAALGGGSKESAQLVRDSRSAWQAYFSETGPNPVQGAEKAAGAAEQQVEKLAEDTADAPDKIIDAAAGAVGQKDLMETKMPESKEAKGEMAKILEELNLVNSVIEHAQASLFHKLTDGKDEEPCKANAMLSWDAGYRGGGGGCTIHVWVIMAVYLGWFLITGGIWMIVCKGKGRSKTPWDAQQLAMPPYKATGICSCFFNLKPLAICEGCWCSFFMWAETMIRSGTLPKVIVYVVGVIVWAVAPVLHSAAFVYCMFRFMGRYKLREKMESTEEQHSQESEETGNAMRDLGAVICGPCAIAQEAEYLELKANEGQPAPDGADLRHLLEWQVEHQEEYKQEHW